MLRARSAFVGLLHCPPGHHAAFLDWHDLDHRPENHGHIPHIFHSQRWIARPESIAHREFAEGTAFADAGQYLMTYWSSAEPRQLLEDMTVLREQLAALGRCDAIGRDFQARWRERMHPVEAFTNPKLGVGPDTAMLLPHDGLVITVGEQAAEPPPLFESLAVVAAVSLTTMAGVDRALFVHLHYTRGEPLETQQAIRGLSGDAPVVLFRGSFVPQHWSEQRYFE
jgi:hypothetical protein